MYDIDTMYNSDILFSFFSAGKSALNGHVSCLEGRRLLAEQIQIVTIYDGLYIGAVFTGGHDR